MFGQQDNNGTAMPPNDQSGFSAMPPPGSMPHPLSMPAPPADVSNSAPLPRLRQARLTPLLRPSLLQIQALLPPPRPRIAAACLILKTAGLAAVKPAG